MRPSPGSIQSGFGIGAPHWAQGFCLGMSPACAVAMVDFCISAFVMAPLPICGRFILAFAHRRE
jgi:hypothetical protein